MKNHLLYIVVSFTLIFSANAAFAQAPNLGTAANFILFTGTGAVSNTGISQITGNVGTQTGAISGFGNINGQVHNNDAVTLLCAADLLAAYTQLNTTIPTAAHGLVLGGGETLNAGVYFIAGAGSLINTLTLDAQGDPNAVFIFQVQGAFAAAASSQVILVNGANACNVFWKVEGAATMAAGTIMKGTIIANNAAVGMGAGCSLEGRALSTTGAVSVYGTVAYIPLGCGAPVLTGPPAPVLASTTCYALFSADGLVTNTGITHVTGDIGTDIGSTSGFDPLNVTGSIHPNPDPSTASCAADLQTLYNYLTGLPADIELLYPVQFGNSLVLTPHTYIMNAATVLTDTFFLNAEGNANAIFVIQINGALTTSTYANVVLINGARSNNVFWKVTGAVSIANYSNFKGTIVCNGAIVMGTGTSLDGRAFTVSGAVTTTASNITIPGLPVTTISYAGSPFCSDAGNASVVLSGITGGIYSSSTGLSINASTGLVNLAASTAGMYTITYTMLTTGSCGQSEAITTINILTAGVWTGIVSTDWNTGANWLCGTVPSATANILIAGGLPNYPELRTSIVAVNNITILTGASVLIDEAAMQISGIINNSGTFNVANGTIEMNAEVAQDIPANAFENNAIKNLNISNSSAAGVNLGGTLDIYGSLTYTISGFTFSTNDLLTLKSTATHTAWIGNMTGKTITGKVTVERYVAAHKAWYLLSIPTNTIETVKQSWQEGAATTGSDPHPGYGTQVTSNRPAWLAEGFDLFSSGGPSVKTFNPVSNSWSGISNTNLAGIKTMNGYMTFIRGDRTANAFNSIPTETVLRTQGNLYTGDQDPVLVTAGQFEVIGNPFPSVIDMRNISKTGIKDFFYVWDPNLGGTQGLGAWQAFSYDGSDYLVTPGSGSYGASGSISNYVESGMAFMVQAKFGGGTVTIKENIKNNESEIPSFSARVVHPQLLCNLYAVNIADSFVMDGTLTDYAENYSNNVDDLDAVKMTNTGVNLSVSSGGRLLVVERKHTITGKDTVFLNLANTTVQQYRFEFIATALAQPGLTGWLEDDYLHSTTLLSLDGTTIFNFSVVNIPGSYAANRFRIVFATAAVLPLTLTSVKAYQEHKNIAVEWKTENESNMKQYEIERAADGSHFTKTAGIAADNAALNNYSWLDEHAMTGYNYYRIKCISTDAGIEYSDVVKVDLKEKGNDPSLIVYPNPVKGNLVSLQFNNINKGAYSIQLFNEAGQLLSNKTFLYDRMSSSEAFKINGNFPPGKYELKLQGEGIELNVAVIKK